ncbi:hypothetical protein GIB67_000605 [Kingdonia uniflora]|uniref:Uncharacterized protein n=1 Tax=Kingdonia uniflora TaxID=39325 RepID=A0A7J7P806_9MAGN|nr:hypothetical protein GIB67_000605 [Kingdonia uniflora]
MDWNISRDSDDVLVVPRNKEKTSDQSQLDSWFQWAEGSNGLSNMCGKFPRTEYGDGFSDDWLYDQLDGLRAMDQTDNFFMSSLPGTILPTVENVYQPVPVIPDSKCSVVPFFENNPLTEVVIGSSDYLNTPPLSTDWNILGDTIPNFMLLDPEKKKATLPRKTTVSVVLAPEKFYIEDIPVEVEISSEVTVLKELAVVMTQKTRICFRDALYRFAKSTESKHLQSQCQCQSQSQSINVEVTMKKPRSDKVKLIELESNNFDMTIASLMFNENSCDAQAQSCVTSVDLSEDATTATSSTT